MNVLAQAVLYAQLNELGIDDIYTTLSFFKDIQHQNHKIPLTYRYIL